MDYGIILFELNSVEDPNIAFPALGSPVIAYYEPIYSALGFAYPYCFPSIANHAPSDDCCCGGWYSNLACIYGFNRLPNHQKGCPIHLVIRLGEGNCAPIELFSAELRDTCQGPCGFGCEIDRMVNDAGALLITHLEQMIVRYKTTFGWRDSPSRGTCLC